MIEFGEKGGAKDATKFDRLKRETVDFVSLALQISALRMSASLSQAARIHKKCTKVLKRKT